MGDLIGYSARSAKALGFLKSHSNDVEVYVEDTGNPNMWAAILRRLLPPNTRLRSVNLLGGKKKVLDACRMDQAVDGRRKLYIIDGDLDLVRGKRKPNLKFLYRLRSYCIENLLINKSSLSIVGAESSPKVPLASVVQQLNFDDVMGDVDKLLRPLFCAYAAIMSCCPQVKTIQNSVHLLLSSGPDIKLEKSKVLALSKKVVREAVGIVGWREFKDGYRKVALRTKNVKATKFVSGKDYIFPILEKRLRFILKYRGTTEQLKVRLANEFDPLAEPTFSAAIAAL